MVLLYTKGRKINIENEQADSQAREQRPKRSEVSKLNAGSIVFSYFADRIGLKTIFLP